MSLIKTLWASVQGDPAFMRKVNGWLTIFWLLMIPVSIATGWIQSVAYISALSLWALVSGHWSAWQAARVEVAQQEEAKQREADPLEEKVVKELVNRTTIEAADASSNAPTATNPEIESMIRALCDQVDQLRHQLPVKQPVPQRTAPAR